MKLPPEGELLAAFEIFQLNPQAEVPMSEAKAAWMSVSNLESDLWPRLDAELSRPLLAGTHEPRDPKRNARELRHVYWQRSRNTTKSPLGGDPAVSVS